MEPDTVDVPSFRLNPRPICQPMYWMLDLIYAKTGAGGRREERVLRIRALLPFQDPPVRRDPACQGCRFLPPPVFG